ncbi:MAG: AAA family ATPase [Candidatus Omnitrophota bacterium]
MTYFKTLGLHKEPFSTSPDPDFFYLSKEHEAALTNIIIELRLKRGLSVILGDVGTGKTTLSRKLIQALTTRDDIIFSVIFDPSFENEYLFLTSLVKNFEIAIAPTATILDLRQSLERFLFQKGVTENKTIVLIIDEAQKLNAASLENLRSLLNYETNEFKLLQLILLGQLELHALVIDMANFFDRISFKYTLNPLGLAETKEMINFRVRQGGYNAMMQLFSDEAIAEIHDYAKGYPRRVMMICHKALKNLILQNKVVVDRQIIKEIISDEMKHGWARTK